MPALAVRQAQWNCFNKRGPTLQEDMRGKNKSKLNLKVKISKIYFNSKKREWKTDYTTNWSKD